MYAIRSYYVTKSLFAVPHHIGRKSALTTIVLASIFFIVEWIGRDNEYGIEKLGLKWKQPVRLTFYLLIILVIFFFV